jgi:cysteinyl-tRNA synthetase
MELEMSPTATATVSTTTHTLVAPAWATEKNWAYQLTGYQNNRLDEIAASGYDLVVIDLARDGSENYFTFEEICNIQATGTIVLAYFEIGAIENYRPEWKTTPDDLKLGPVAGWPDEYYVRYWDPRWWPIIKGRIDQALAAGFDGAYLDMIVSYEEISIRDAGMDDVARAQAMVDLIAAVSEYAKEHNPAFKIVPQNAPELYTWPGYLEAIDGLGMEELYFRATDESCTADWCAENREAALAIKAAGKLILTVDYATQPDNVRAAYAHSHADGFVPFVTAVELDKLPDHP